MTDDKLIDYSADSPDDPAWLREQREQAAEANVHLGELSPSYGREMRDAEIRLQHVRETVKPTGLTDADVRRLEHPNEFPHVRTVISEPATVGRRVGVVDEYGTVWSGEPGTSKVIGDLIPRKRDEETSYLYLRRRWWRR